MKRYRIDMKRVVTNVMILATIFVLFNSIGSFTFGSKNIETKTIMVQRHDTLWSIAEDVCKASTEDLNVQNVIIEIKNINNLNSSDIYIGQELNIPIYM